MKKILYINNVIFEYLSVGLYHGLALRDDVELTVSKELEWMYDDIELSQEDRNNIYGRGYTFSNILNRNQTNIKVIDDTIEDKIREHYFDFIVYAFIWDSQDYFDLVCECYEQDEIILVDGNDSSILWTSCRNMYDINKCTYFKRELYDSSIMTGNPYKYVNLYPISFAIPACKIIDIDIDDKMAHIQQPCIDNRNNLHFMNVTYNSYDTEEEYYNSYYCSAFGFTSKKYGWDCMRHYEIVAAGCLPYFENFEYLPRTIMTTWPTALQIEANDMVNMIWTKGLEYGYHLKYKALLCEFIDYAKKYLTTEYMAKYFLDRLDRTY